MGVRILAVVDRADRGTAQEYADLIDFCVGMRTTFGSMDLVLRGSAVGCAVNGQEAADAGAGTLAYSVRRVRALLRIGVRVWVDEADLAGLGRAEAAVLGGVVATDTDALATSWHEYEEVWFL